MLLTWEYLITTLALPKELRNVDSLNYTLGEFTQLLWNMTSIVGLHSALFSFFETAKELTKAWSCKENIEANNKDLHLLGSANMWRFTFQYFICTQSDQGKVFTRREGA